LISLFILDFLCIHPFNGGNGRMSRLLTLLLYRSGYIVGKYVSIEKMIERTKETYYEALYQSSTGWHEEQNQDIPFVNYLLGVILAAYREFSQRMQLLSDGSLSKPERLRTDPKNHREYVRKDHKSRNYAKMPGHQSGDSAEDSDRAAKERRDHQTQRRKVCRLYLEQGERIT